MNGVADHVFSNGLSISATRLVPLKNLTTLRLWNTEVTDAGLKELPKTLPKCKISKCPAAWASRGRRGESSAGDLFRQVETSPSTSRTQRLRPRAIASPGRRPPRQIRAWAPRAVACSGRPRWGLTGSLGIYWKML